MYLKCPSVTARTGIKWCNWLAANANCIVRFSLLANLPYRALPCICLGGFISERLSTVGPKSVKLTKLYSLPVALLAKCCHLGGKYTIRGTLNPLSYKYPFPRGMQPPWSLKKNIIVFSSSPFSFKSFMKNPSQVSTSCTASRWPA